MCVCVCVCARVRARTYGLIPLEFTFIYLFFTLYGQNYKFICSQIQNFAPMIYRFFRACLVRKLELNGIRT